MRIFASIFASLTLLAVSASAQAPVPIGPRNVKIEKISPAFLTTPEFTIRGTPDKRSPALKWFEIEVEFAVEGVELVDELSFRYDVLMNGKLYPGDITHVNIPKGNARYSVMYISPRTLERIAGVGKPLHPGMIENIWVTISKQGQVLAISSWKDKGKPVPNYAQTPGMLLPKSETPFQVLWWDRYEAVRVPSR